MAEDVFGLVGTTVAGAFRVESVVAEGGFAVVYRAHHEGFRAAVALKCLKIPQYLNTDEQRRFLDQFQAEAELLFKLSASIPTVVRPLHVDAIRTHERAFIPFMALEWLEGETLDALVRRRAREHRPLSLDELIQLLTPVARALERAHNFVGPEGPISIVHRDMKPENVFVARVAGESVVKILDFGIGKAKSVASQVAGQTSQADVGVSSFTPAYGAPEQWVPKRFGQTGPWTDVWGLALTLVELLAARPIVDGDQAAMMGTVLDANRRPTPRNEGIAVSEEVEAVFARALALDPRHRYLEAGAFWNALCQAAGVRALSDPRVEPGSLPPTIERISGAPPHTASGAYRAIAGGDGVQALRAGGIPSDGRGGFGNQHLIPDLETGPPAQGSVVPGSLPPSPLEGRPSGLDLDLAPGEIPSQRPPPRPLSGTSWRAPVDQADGGVPAPRSSQSSARWRLGSFSGEPRPADATEASAPTESAPPAGARGSRRLHQSQMAAPDSGPGTPQGSMHGADVPVAHGSQIGEEAEPLWRRLLLPGSLIVLGVLVTVVDGAYAASTGEMLSLGPLRPAWLAGGLVLAGIGILVYRLVFPSED